MQSVAFTEDETLTYLQGQRDWIEYPSRQRQKDDFRFATTGTVAIGSDSRGGGNNSAPITFFDAIILRARLYENSKLQAGQARRTVLSNQRAALLSATYRSGVTDAAASAQPSFSARSRIVAVRITRLRRKSLASHCIRN